MSLKSEEIAPATTLKDLPLVTQCKADLRQAVKDGNLNDTEKCLVRLAKSPANIRMELSRLDEEGLTVLHQAIFVPQGLALLKLLVRYGGDIGVRDEEGCTLLHTAAMVSSMPIAGWLINEGANLAAFDREGHLPMDRCDDPLLQDVLFQAMARAGLVGLAMPTQMDWNDRISGQEYLTGDSDYGTSSSVGSLSEDEDRLSLHSTHSFSSTDECCADRESPVSESGARSVDSLTSGVAGSVPPACARLVRVKETNVCKLWDTVDVHHVRIESPPLARNIVSVVRRFEPGLRQVETVFIATPNDVACAADSCRTLSADDSTSRDDINHPAGTAVCLGVVAADLDDKVAVHVSCLASTATPSSSLAVDDFVLHSDRKLTGLGSHAASQASIPLPVQAARDDTTSSSTGSASDNDLDLGSQLVDNEDEYLDGLVSGSSSDETIRAAESDAESILTDLSSYPSEEHQPSSQEDLETYRLCQVADESLIESTVHSQDVVRAEAHITETALSVSSHVAFVEESSRQHRKLVSSVGFLTEFTSVEGNAVAGSDVTQSINDTQCQGTCQAEVPKASLVAIAHDSMEVRDYPSPKYPIKSEKRLIGRAKFSADYSGSGKGISRRNTVSEVDMGWVAPRQVKPKKSFQRSSKPLKSLLRRSSVAEYDRPSNEAPVVRRKKSVSFPAEVLLADAIHDGDREEVRGLLVSGAIAVDGLLDNGLTPLHSAVLERQREIVKLLLNHGAHVEQRDSDGWTALHAAATEGTVPVTHLLLENGADPWLKTLKEKKTAYELASNDNVRLVLSKAMGEAYRSISLVPPSLASESSSETDDNDDDLGEEDEEGLEEESEIDDEDDDVIEDARCRESDVEDNNSHSDEEDDTDSEDDSSNKTTLETVKAETPIAITTTATPDAVAIFVPVHQHPAVDKPAATKSKSSDVLGAGDSDVHFVFPCAVHQELAGKPVSPSSSHVPAKRCSLVEAIASRDTPLVEQLIEDATADELSVTSDPDGGTLLHAAARWGCLAVVEKLLDYGLRVNSRDKEDRFPLDVAKEEKVRITLRRAMIRQRGRCYSTDI